MIPINTPLLFIVVCYFSSKSKHTEFTQYLFPVEVGPSSKIWPKCEPQRAQVISVLSPPSPRLRRAGIPCNDSVWYSTAPDNALSKEGHPVPESNFAPEEKSGLPHALHSYVPSAFSCTYSPENGASVPFSRKTAYSSAVSACLNPSSFSGIGFFITYINT